MISQKLLMGGEADRPAPATQPQVREARKFVPAQTDVRPCRTLQKMAVWERRSPDRSNVTSRRRAPLPPLFPPSEATLEQLWKSFGRTFTILLWCSRLAAVENPPEATPFDPDAGIAPDGRIPKVVLPADLPHPDRWRYIPEGRIKPGDPLDRFAVSTFIAPIFFAEQDIGYGGGIALTDIDFRQQRRREFAGIFLTYSSEGQQDYWLVWQRFLNTRDLPGGGVVQEERGWLRVVGGYQKTLTRRFFGLGPGSTADDETSYTDELGGAGLEYQNSLPEPGSDLMVRLGLMFVHHELEPGRVADAADTRTVHPGLVQTADGAGALWGKAGLEWNSQDSIHYPYRGWRWAADLGVLPMADHDLHGAKLHLDAGHTLPLPPLFHDGGRTDEENPPTDVLAFDLGYWRAWGRLPFYDLPSLGGSDTLRGYIQNRFTGPVAWHASGEYRLWVIPRGFRLTDSIRIERLGLAPFAEIGNVAEDEAGLFGHRPAWSLGLGWRAALERTAVFRCDVGFSDEDINVVLGYGMSY